MQGMCIQDAHLKTGGEGLEIGQNNNNKVVKPPHEDVQSKSDRK